MPFPKQSDVELPLLRALLEIGGSARPKDLYPRVAVCFPDLTQEEQEERLENFPSTRKWWNLVQWARQSLVDAGELDGSTRGVWKITEAGRTRVLGSDADHQAAGRSGGASSTNLRDLVNQSRDDAKSRLLLELKQLTPSGFERFCKELLGQLGYQDVAVTRRSGDGGIDGYGDYRQGAVRIKSAFQAKRWTDNPVGRPEIDRFRGAIQGDYDHGVFITTSRFTKDAENSSFRKGAITILLLDGSSITDLMLERGIGVVKEPIYMYEIEPEFFDFDDEEPS